MNLDTGSQFFRWQPKAWLHASGSDALNFLQGQFTNDLRTLVEDGAVYGLWLNQKGKVVADSFVLPTADGTAYWVGSYFSTATVLRERLETYIIADDVLIEDETDQWQAVTIFSTVDRSAMLKAVPGSLMFPGRRDDCQHCEWVYPKSSAPHLEAILAGMGELVETQMELRRVKAGIPAIPQDIGAGELPDEGGLSEAAISYTKGCYLGQEVMARLKSMGQVRRRLQRVNGYGPVPALPAALFQGERRVGELRSAVPTDSGYAGLALLALLNLSPAAGLSLQPNTMVKVEIANTP